MTEHAPHATRVDGIDEHGLRADAVGPYLTFVLAGADAGRWPVRAPSGRM